MDTGLIVTLFAIGAHYLFLMLVFKDYDNKIKDLQDKVEKLEKRNQQSVQPTDGTLRDLQGLS